LRELGEEGLILGELDEEGEEKCVEEGFILRELYERGFIFGELSEGLILGEQGEECEGELGEGECGIEGLKEYGEQCLKPGDCREYVWSAVICTEECLTLGTLT
jgi:hypothetical protein